MSIEEQCPLNIPVPLSITVNTSGSTPYPTTNVHSLSTTHSGFTRISEFTFTSNLTGDPLSIQDQTLSKILYIYQKNHLLIF